ncbi:putative bifunctional diguanylate cyclase/phosphodiesterase [Agarivorans sp. QJM3NY_25]|uniref:putative bifunctional diguanylate cyclase/phosphodiesterase n=1 Tax=Agarivorans sp. QJM3NY_25 TaxID=3421430 RepID=UPI003D7CA303
MSSLLLLRLIDLWWWKRHQQSTKLDEVKAIQRFIIGANLTALMWSTYIVYVITSKYSSDLDLSTHMIIVAAMAGGSATTLAGHKYTAMFYASSTVAFPALALLLSGQYERQVLGMLGIICSLAMLVVAKRNAAFTQQAIMLKNQNVTLVQQMEKKVEQRTRTIYQLSNLDPLTGLFNRSAFLEHLAQQLQQSAQAKQHLALLFIDLDGFKKINDAIGHDTGDQVLTNTATRLKQLATNQQLLCRWGGDEFLLALENSDHQPAIALANKVIQTLSEAYSFENNRLSVGATVGIAFYPEHAQDEHSLIRLADTAMYAQKKLSPSTVGLFSQQLEQKIHRELRLKDGLSQAIDKQQFSLVFQPILRSSDKQIVSFEALIRWQFNGEWISPDEFISIAEQYGLIRKIGVWVLNSACQEAALWPAQQQFAVCVNVSVIQLQDQDFIEIVEHALSASQLHPEQLHIEMTESVFTSDIVLLSQQIKDLQDKGIKVSIDDFGTGYSSLSIMQDLAVNTVKIDRSFVSRMETNGYAIIKAVMHIAKSLNHSVVAEGIETERQMNQLTELGVDYLQGYYFAKPLPVEQVRQLIEASKLNH